MTKKDLKTVAIGGAVGLGAIAAFWFFFRRVKKIPVINPAIIQWEGP